MILKDYLEIFSRRKWSIIITTSVVLIIVAVGLLIIPPKISSHNEIANNHRDFGRCRLCTVRCDLHRAINADLY